MISHDAVQNAWDVLNVLEFIRAGYWDGWSFDGAIAWRLGILPRIIVGYVG